MCLSMYARGILLSNCQLEIAMGLFYAYIKSVSDSECLAAETSTRTGRIAPVELSSEL